MSPTHVDGLTSTEAARRLAEHGNNALPEPRRVALWLRFLRQFQNPLDRKSVV